VNGDQQAPPGRHHAGLSRTASPAVAAFTCCGSRPTAAPGGNSRQAVDDRPPLTSHLQLGPLLSAASSARAHTRAVLAQWGLPELAEIAELLVSELVTNALRASQALRQPLPSPVHLWLRADRLGLVATVWDANPQPPIRRKARHDAVSGRGLQIVQALSSRWGWYEPPDMGGKCVWCETQAESQPTQHSAVSDQLWDSPDSRVLWS
jgi:anti-sigma regulatory factor (Ser/Thr protein kinase)